MGFCQQTQIAGRLILENTCHISYNTIYRAIYAGMFDEPGLSHGNRGAVRKLRHKGKSRHTKVYDERRGKIKISNHLADRPVEAQMRSRIGDWEADTVLGKAGGACLMTITDRKSRFLIAAKAQRKTADCIASEMIKSLKGQPLYSITPDRGKEFANHCKVTEALGGVQFYFPLPHQPWQRGTNENTNGLLREYFPKFTDISVLSDEYIQSKIDELNRRPRKCLGFLTPYEIYFEEMLHLT